MLIGQFLIQGTGHHPAHLMPESLNFGERRIQWRALRPVFANRYRGNAIFEFLLCLIREYHLLLSVLAHASFLSK
jgi:hypothetical protein